MTERTMKLRTELTDEEIHEKGSQMAQLECERLALAADKRESAKTYKNKIDQKAAQISELSNEIMTRHEMREVIVQEMREGKHMVTYRCDTGAAFNRRKLTQSEEEGLEDIGADADMGARASSGSRIPNETPSAGRVRVTKPADPWQTTAERAKRAAKEDEK